MSTFKDAILKKRYFLRELASSGGMAIVDKAWDQSRLVELAIKFLHSHLAKDRVFLRDFKREAQTRAKPQHTNTMQYYG